MDTKHIIDEMDTWLTENYEDVVPRKIPGCYHANMNAIMAGSYEEAAHLKWMIGEMRTMTDVEKLMRWIGFMQGALWSLGFGSIDEFRGMNSG